MTNETPQFFLNRDSRRLFGILYEPAPTAAPARDLAVVVCAPLYEDKLWSNRVLVNCARYFASQGAHVLRFDYFGDGESEGRFEDASVDSRIADIADAVEFCRRSTGVTRVYLLGLCFGATLAVCAAQRLGIGAGTVAWAPILDGERHMGEILRGHLSAQMVVHRKIVHDRQALVRQIMEDQTVNVEGYEIGKELYTQMVALDLRATLRDTASPVLVVPISPGAQVEPQYESIRSLGNARVEFQPVRELKFWTQQRVVFPECRELFETSWRWLGGLATN